MPEKSSDDSSQTWSWTSVCGRARIDIPACQQMIFITHPLQVSRIPAKDNADSEQIPTKYIHVFAPIRRCFSREKLPAYLSTFVNKCLQLIEQLCTDSYSLDYGHCDDWHFQLPLPLPSSSCPNAHRHRLHHEMMFESDIHILQTSTLTYRFEYDPPARIEALVFEENTQRLIDFITTNEIQSSFYQYYSVKNKVPPMNEGSERLFSLCSNRNVNC